MPLTSWSLATEQSPPVQRIPNHLLPQTPQTAATILLEKSDSSRDSPYEMYIYDGTPAIFRDAKLSNSSSNRNAVRKVPQTAAAIPLEKSNSSNDSPYEMYIGDGTPAIFRDAKLPNSLSNRDAALHNLDPGATVKVLADGENVWTIVGGLSEDDEEPLYLAPEYT